VITGWARFPSPGVGFRAEGLILSDHTAFGGAARPKGRREGRPRTMRGATEGPVGVGHPRSVRPLKARREQAWTMRGATEGPVGFDIHVREAKEGLARSKRGPCAPPRKARCAVGAAATPPPLAQTPALDRQPGL
jgi:hypothetical protein